MNKTTLIFSALALIAMSTQGRPVRIWQPEELYEKADVVIIGVVEQIRDTGRVGAIRLGENAPLPVRNFQATVRVVGVVKGKTENTVVIEYAPLDRKALRQGVVNGPGRFMVQKDKMYLLYLKRTVDSTVLVGALSGEFDDDQAVKLLPQQSENVFPGFDSSVVAKGAVLTWMNYVKWSIETKASPVEWDFPAQLWAKAVADLKPKYVYKHGVNIVIVRSCHEGIEDGFYVALGISSGPGPNDEQFTRMLIAQHAEGSVYTFHREGHFEPATQDDPKKDTALKQGILPTE